jgi:hypothetical protein
VRRVGFSKRLGLIAGLLASAVLLAGFVQGPALAAPGSGSGSIAFSVFDRYHSIHAARQPEPVVN